MLLKTRLSFILQGKQNSYESMANQIKTLFLPDTTIIKPPVRCAVAAGAQ